MQSVWDQERRVPHPCDFQVVEFTSLASELRGVWRAFRCPPQKRLTLSPATHRIFTVPRRNFPAFVALRGQDKYPDAIAPSAFGCHARSLSVFVLRRCCLSALARTAIFIRFCPAKSRSSYRPRRSLSPQHSRRRLHESTTPRRRAKALRTIPRCRSTI